MMLPYVATPHNWRHTHLLAEFMREEDTIGLGAAMTLCGLWLLEQRGRPMPVVARLASCLALEPFSAPTR